MAGFGFGLLNFLMIRLIVAAELCLFYSNESYVSLTLNNDACDLFRICNIFCYVCYVKEKPSSEKEAEHALYVYVGLKFKTK